MTSDGLVLYKLIILYMLSRVDFPLTISQISQFILDFNSSAFFDLQIGLNELSDNDFIKPTTVRNHTLYEITEQGLEAVERFDFKIDASIKQQVINYLKEQKIQLRSESSVTSDYYPTDDEFIVQCSITEKKQTVLEIKIAVPTKEQAITACDTWKKKSEKVYQYLINEMWQDS